MQSKLILVGGAAALVLAGSAVAIESASAAASTHTLKVNLKQLSVKQTGESYVEEADALIKGKTKVGYSVESCFFGGTKDQCTASFALKGGIIYGTYTFPITAGADPDAHGKIRGGSGTYSDAKGSIRIAYVGAKGTVTLTYTD